MAFFESSIKSWATLLPALLRMLFDSPLDAMESCNSSEAPDCGLQRFASEHVAHLRSLSRSKPPKPSSSLEDLPFENDPDDDESKSFVERQLDATTPLPPLTWSNLLGRIIWFNLITVALTPLLSIYGILTTPIVSRTVLFSIAYYVWNMLGITAGYHRLWSHRSYNAARSLQLFYALAGAGAVQGSIRWWSRSHRAHHRYTDTDLDPYGAHHGFWWSHIGWMLVKPGRRTGPADIRDLRNNSVVDWQHRHFFMLAFVFGLLVPAAVPGVFWHDWRGGIFFAGFLRLTCVHHSTFSVNSLAHWLGHTTFDDKLTPRDHLLTAIVTLGEGYHNFHHQFPIDYRNAVKWYQWDPTKWFIATCSYVGLASHLRKFPDVEVKKSQLTMKLKSLKNEAELLPVPVPHDDLPVISWESFQEQSRSRPLITIAGFIHDIDVFVDQHPGGRALLDQHFGKDATAAFFGGVYDHSHAAQNLLATMRVGVLHGGLEHIDELAIPPWQRLQIVRWAEVK